VKSWHRKKQGYENNHDPKLFSEEKAAKVGRDASMVMQDFLFHYYDKSTGPFLNLSDLESADAERIMEEIRNGGKGFASRRPIDYLAIRRELETRARTLFEQKGGKPIRAYPHYMTLGQCPWLLKWYGNGMELKISIDLFDPMTVSFTYGDLFPTMRFQDNKPYRRQVYTLPEICNLINRFGLPQEWNADGSHGPERYIEAQIWDDRPLAIYKE
jgi:hypothetical protein